MGAVVPSLGLRAVIDTMPEARPKGDEHRPHPGGLDGQVRLQAGPVQSFGRAHSVHTACATQGRHPKKATRHWNQPEPSGC
jgi:hypothetical protein